jgi:hypothetical protein
VNKGVGNVWGYFDSTALHVFQDSFGVGDAMICDHALEQGLV